MTVLGEHVRRARKAHQCDYCGEPITLGLHYLRWGWRDHGTVDTVTAHLTCAHYASAVYDVWDTAWDERWVCSDGAGHLVWSAGWVTDDGHWLGPAASPAEVSALRARVAELEAAAAAPVAVRVAP